MTNILCYGDSNTYGYIPDGSGRFDENTRWTKRLQQSLGESCHVIEEGLCGRTISFHDNDRPGRCGQETIAVMVESHNPLDLIIIMLGTNDCKKCYQATPAVVKEGLREMVHTVRAYASPGAKILLVSPIHLAQGVGEPGYDLAFDEMSVELSYQLADVTEELAKEEQLACFAASRVASPSTIDREHLDATGHAKLAIALEEKVRKVLEIQ